MEIYVRTVTTLIEKNIVTRSLKMITKKENKSCKLCE